MKKIFLPFTLLLLILSACGEEESTGQESNNSTDNENNEVTNDTNDSDSSSDTITYESEAGPIEVPADPQRVAVVSAFAGNVIALDVNLVGVDQWSKANPLFENELEDVEEVSDESLEKLIELEPDLIIGYSDINNLNKLQEIAPTVTYTYGQVDYLTQQVEIGKLLNKEEEAQTWVDDFQARAQNAGKEVKEVIGEDATVSVFENFDKQLYIFGDSWGRGTEILYQEMELAMPDKVVEMVLSDGYYALSAEVLPEFAGDYMIFSRVEDTDNSFTDTDTYQNIPAVKNDQVFVVDAQSFYFNDPIALDHQLKLFKEFFLEQ